jgi:hypothetical protein
MLGSSLDFTSETQSTVIKSLMLLVQGPGRAEPGDADAGLHPRLLLDFRLPRRPDELHEPREARRVRRHVHGRAREGRRDRLSRRHRQAAAAGMI